MIPPEPSLTSHKLHVENTQRFRPAGKPPNPSQSAQTPSFSADSSSSMAIYGVRKSSRGSVSGVATSSPPNGASNNRDSHDLQLSMGAGRESLVDNLLLSFDRFGDGSLGAFDTSPYFSTVDELGDEDSLSNYSPTNSGSRGRRSNSTSNYHSHNGNFSSTGNPGHTNRRVGSFDNGTDGFGAGYDLGRELRSRGCGLGSSHGYTNTASYDTYDAAPPPSIRSGPRNRSPSPPRSPRLVRRPSNKSAKSLRRDQQHQFNPQSDNPVALPPLPAFMTPATITTPMSPSNSKSSGRPGFFRRVFGVGGGGGNNGSSSSKSNAANLIARETANPSANSQSSNSPQSTINKKPSFFRRRKRSDATSHPIAPLPLHTTEPLSVENSHPSPATSLSTAMNPYLRSPVKSPGFDLVDENNESAYLQKGATIRTVTSSDPISPKRPTFFGESMRHRDSGSHFNDDYSSTGNVYRKETRYARGNGNVDYSFGARDDWDRPQTSPYSPNKQSFLQDNEEKEMRWPPLATKSILSTRRSVGNVALERERQASIASSFDKPRQGSVVAKEQPIATVREIEAHHAKLDKQQREARAGKALEVDTRNLENRERKGAETSWPSTLTPATTRTPTVMLQRDGPGEKAEPLREDDPDREEPSKEEREIVRRVFEGDEEIIAKARVTNWLGETGAAGARIRRAYMGLFDWSGINILSSLRIFCGRLVFKGETQQVDRIMDAIAKRWCECNPHHGFKLIDVVFTILYSLLLLNTDLHIADIPQSQKMTRSQFIKNTMSSIRRIVAEAPVESKPAHYNTFPPRSQTPFHSSDDDDGPGMSAVPSATFPLVARERKMSESRTSLDFVKGTKNSGKASGIGNLSPRGAGDPSEKIDYDMDGGLALVKAPLGGSGGIRAWETQIETVLKDFYASVKASALPLHGAPQEKVVETPHHSSLSVFGSNVLRRSPSTISRAPSELSVSNRNNRDSKLGAKWTAKNRSRPRLYNGSYAGSSRTSLEDRSMWSPSASSTWSKYSLDKTQTSMSVDSLGSAFTHADYAQSIGFANALSHAIIREEAASGTSVDDRESALLDYDELELAGAPWAKEGMLKHKHHLESMDKKAKNRGWTECFAVIERGWMRLFQFNQSGKNKDAVVGVVGGGNWTESADAIGSFLLRQTIASALPPPGYSKARPNVWALSLPSGAVHFFEVGTAEIVKEFVSTANYWAARLSKEPLTGGVSNVEYGWSDNVLGEIGPGLTSSVSNTNESRPSLQISIRSSLDHGTMVRPRLPGDRVNITDWAPPSQSMVASSLGEADQLRALETYVANIEAELARHNDLRPTMVLTFSPRHPNSSKAMSNWEKKSSYLLREIIKFRTYIECLSSATQLRERLRVGENGAEVGNDNESRSPIST